MDRSGGSSEQMSRGQNQIQIPYWEQQGSTSSQYRHLIEENRYFKNRCKHLESHLQDNHKEFNSLNELFVRAEVNEHRLMRENQQLRKLNRELINDHTQNKLIFQDWESEKNIYIKRQSQNRQRMIKSKAKQRQLENQIYQLQQELQIYKTKNISQSRGNIKEQLERQQKLKKHYNDIVVEVQNKWSSSFKQLENEYNKKCREIRQKNQEVKNYNKTIKQLKQQIQTITIQLNAERDSALRNSAKSKATINDLEKQLKQLKGVNQELSLKNYTIQNQKNDLRFKLKQENAKLIKLQRQYKQIIQNLNQKNNTIKNMEMEISQLNELIQKMKQQKTQFQREKHQKQDNELKQVDFQYSLKKEIQKQKNVEKQNADLLQINKQFQNQILMKDTKIILLEKEIQDLKKISNEMKLRYIQIQPKQGEHSLCQAQNKRLLQAMELQKNTINKHISTIGQLNKKIEELTFELSQLQAEKSQLSRKAQNDKYKADQDKTRLDRLVKQVSKITEQRNTFQLLYEEEKSKNYDLTSSLQTKRQDGLVKQQNKQIIANISKENQEKIKLLEYNLKEKQTIIYNLQNQISSVQQQLTHFKNKYKQTSKENIDKLKKMDLKLQQAQNIINQKQQTINHANDEMIQLNKKVKDLEKIYNQKHKKNESKLQQKEKDLKMLQAQGEQQQKQIENLNEKIKSLQKELKNRQLQNNKKDKKIKQLDQILKQNKIKLEEMENQLTSKSENSIDAIQNLKKEMEKLRKQLKIEQNTNINLKEQLENRKQNFKSDLNRQKSYDKLERQLQDKIKKLKQQTKRKDDQNDILRNQVITLTAKINETQLNGLNFKIEREYQEKIIRLQRQIKDHIERKKIQQKQYQGLKNASILQIEQLKKELQLKILMHEDNDKQNKMGGNTEDNLSLQQLEGEYNRQLQALRRLILYKGYKQDDGSKKWEELKSIYDAKITAFMNDYQNMQREMCILKEQLLLAPIISSAPIVQTVVQYVPCQCSYQLSSYHDSVMVHETLLTYERQREVFIDKIATWEKRYEELKLLFEAKLQSKEQTINLLNLKLNNLDISKGIISYHYQNIHR